MSFLCWETLTVKNCPKKRASEIIRALDEDDLFSEAFWCDSYTWWNDELFITSNNATNLGVNGYGDFAEFTKTFPEQLFMIEGEDETGNLYRQYFRNGRVVEYKPTLIWPEFKPEDLE